MEQQLKKLLEHEKKAARRQSVQQPEVRARFKD